MLTKISRFLNVVIVAVFAASLLPFHAFAVETTGSLKGVVQDSSGTALPGITVVVTSDAMIGGARTVLTDDQGRYRFPALPIGKYVVKAQHEGFRTAESHTYLGIGAEVVVDFAMQLPTAEETFVITDVRPVVDTEKTESGATLDSTFLKNIPSGRTYQGAIQFVPGVTGGGNPNVHGETLYSNSYLLDGVNITDPVTHTFSTNFNFDAIEAIEVITGGYDAEYGQATGAIVNIVTKSGGNQLTVDSSAYYGDFNLVSGGQRDVGKFQDANFNLNVGGPVLKDRIWFFTSYELNRISNQPAIRTNINTGASTADPRVFLGHYLLGKLTFQVNPAHKVTAQVQSDPTTISNIYGNSYTYGDAKTLREQGGANYSLAHDWVMSATTLLRTQIAFVDSIINDVSERRDFTTPAHLNQNGDQSANSTDYYWDRRQRLVVHSKVTHFLDELMGSHKVGAGVDFNRDRYPVVLGFNGDAAYVDDGYLCNGPNGPQPCGAGETDFVYDEGGSPVGAPYLKYEFTGANRTVANGFLLGLWLQDEWKPVENLTLKIGGRFDHSEYFNDVGAAVINFNTFAPRLYLAWDPTKDQKTVITAGYAQSYDNGSLLIPDFVKRRSVTGRIYQWDGAQYSYAGDYGAADGFELKKLRAPVKNEVQLGFKREVATNFALGARLIVARTQYYFEDDESNVIWNADGSDAIGFKDGVDRYIFSLGTPANSYRDYRGLEFTLTKAISNGWFVDGSYTLGDARGTNEAPISYFADNPVQNKYLTDGELSYNVANALKVQATKELPMGFTLAGAYFFETGNPYDRTYYNSYYESYSDYRNKPGEFHYEPSQRIDLRAQWTRKIGRNQLTVIGDVFNILDSRTVTQRATQYDPEVPDNSQPFGTILDKQDPLRAQVAVRYNF